MADSHHIENTFWQ